MLVAPPFFSFNHHLIMCFLITQKEFFGVEFVSSDADMYFFQNTHENAKIPMKKLNSFNGVADISDNTSQSKKKKRKCQGLSIYFLILVCIFHFTLIL